MTEVERPVVILSNRGPLAFSVDAAGDLVGRRGAGGLVSGIAPLVAGADAIWLAAAMSDDDRAAARLGTAVADGLRVRLLDIDPATYRAFYDDICNATLWFAIHGLFDIARSPELDDAWWAAWDAYRRVNDAFADAAAETAPPGAVVLVQDYHLALVAPRLRAARPDVRCVFFSHTAWCDPDGFVPLADAGAELLAGIAANHAVGFHTARWATAFERCVEAQAGGSGAPTFVAPLGPDPDDLLTARASDRCAAAVAELRERVGDRHLVVRVDRLELSKNVLRGFAAFDALLERGPEWRGHVTFLAFCYASRTGLGQYARYNDDVVARVAAINARWRTADWEPIVLHTDDDFPRSIAALTIADVVLVNPVRDGMNLVAKEQALVNERDAALVLSTEAGAWHELGHHGALTVNPFDVAGTAAAIDAGLRMGAEERRDRHASLRAATLARTPRDWLADQLSPPVASPR